MHDRCLSQAHATGFVIFKPQTVRNATDMISIDISAQAMPENCVATHPSWHNKLERKLHEALLR
jgi:hypothetical protein